MGHRMLQGASDLSDGPSDTLRGGGRLQIAIPALDADECAMLREIAVRIRRLDTRNMVVERALQDIAAAVENPAGIGVDGAPT